MVLNKHVLLWAHLFVVEAATVERDTRTVLPPYKAVYLVGISRFPITAI